MAQLDALWQNIGIDVSTKNFGYLIAYILPGFLALWGLSYFSPQIHGWLGAASTATPSVGGFLYVTLGSVGAGLLVSTVRWFFIDMIHHRTGIRQPDWDFSQLGKRAAAFDILIEIHYRYFQFYANSMIAVTVAILLRWVAIGIQWMELPALLLFVVLFFAASRDTLRKYYARVDGLLSSETSTSCPSDGEVYSSVSSSKSESSQPNT